MRASTSSLLRLTASQAMMQNLCSSLGLGYVTSILGLAGYVCSRACIATDMQLLHTPPLASWWGRAQAPHSSQYLA